MLGYKSLMLALAFMTALPVSMAHATPAEVLIIRHGEKPPSASLTNNDDDEGDVSPDLSARGYERANALPKLFMQDARFLEYGTPVAIYAGSPKHAKRGSQRPLETIQPTAKALSLQPNTKFISKDFADMVAEVMSTKAYNGKTVLISWPHDEIPDMAHEFGVKNKNVPEWKGKIFDRVWKIHFSSNGDVTSFENAPNVCYQAIHKTKTRRVRERELVVYCAIAISRSRASLARISAA